MQESAQRLMARPQLGSEVFCRGAPEPIEIVQNSRYEASLYDLLKAYARNKVLQLLKLLKPTVWLSRLVPKLFFETIKYKMKDS